MPDFMFHPAVHPLHLYRADYLRQFRRQGNRCPALTFKPLTTMTVDDVKGSISLAI